MALGEAPASGKILTKASDATAGNLTINFTISIPAAGAEIKLSNTEGQTKTWSKDHSYAKTTEITETTAEQFYATATVQISRIYLTSDVNKAALEATALKDYAGSYDGFKVALDSDTTNNAGRLSITAPTSGTNWVIAGTAAIPFSVSIDNNGVASVKGLVSNGADFYVAVTGSDTEYEGGETAKFVVTNA